MPDHNHWRAFAADFPELVECYIKTDKMARRLRALKSELAHVEHASPVPLAEEIDGIEREITGRLDAEELMIAESLGADHPFAANFVERWRENDSLKQGGPRFRDYLVLPAFANEIRGLPQVQRLHDLDLQRSVLAGLLAVQRGQMVDGTLEDTHVPPEDKERRGKVLREKITELEADLERTPSPGWREWDWVDGGADVLEMLAQEYLGYLSNCPKGYFIEVEHREKASPGLVAFEQIKYGGAAADAWEMDNDDRIRAAQALVAYMAEKAEAS